MSRLKTLLILALALSFVACASGPQPAPDAEKSAVAVPLIPRAVLFDNPEKAGAQLSPDGTRISYLAPVDGVLNVWVQTLSKDDAKPVTKDKKRGVRIHFWTEDSKYIIYLQDKGGDENWQVHQVNPDTTEDKILTPFEGVRSGIVSLSKRKPDEMLIYMNRRNKTLFDVYRVDLKTGKMEVDTLNPGHVMMWLADEDLQVRAAVAFDQEGQTLLLVRDTVKDKWRLLRSWTPLEEGGAVTFSADGNSLIVAGNKDTDTKRLYSMEIKTGKISEIFHDPKADFVDGLISPDDKVVEAVANERLRKKWTILDKRVEKDFEILRQLNQDDFKVVSRTKDDQKWIVAVDKDVRGVIYYLYDRAAGKTAHLFDARPKLKEYKLAPMQPLEIKSRDGLELVSYLTRPLQAKEGEPSSKLPLVLWVHGGPWARDLWGYEPYVQWLANRGYVVLQVNFRGSNGFGKKFLNAGNKEWGRKMQDDLTDAVKWAIDNANIDPQKVGIMGGSYGGYATLAGVTFTPDLYAAAVDIVGPSNIITLMKTVPPYWKPMMCIFRNRVGDMEGDKEMLEERSPLNYADKIKTPLFIFQGANDPRVKQAESDQIVKAIRDKGGRVDYVVYADEGHGFARPPNRMDFVGRAEQFLKEILGGRSEPHTPPEGTTAQVK